MTEHAMHPIEALAAAMFRDDMAPLEWGQATDQQRETYIDTAFEAAHAYNRLQRLRVDAFLVRCRND